MEITKELILNHNLTLEEYEKIKKILGREPNITELGMFSVLWSEHCSYKSSKLMLKELPTEGKQVLQGPGENAGAIDIGDGLAIVMKVESHNHPSAIEPYRGAATGVGGILRDIFTMGARPIALLNSLRFGNYDKKRSKYLLSGVVSGIAGYGNCVGVPTVAGEVYFDDCYDGNPLVNVMCVGIVKADSIVKAIANGQGNPVIYAGSTTGRDGLGGAAFASKELNDKSEEDRPAVQVGDPFLEKLLIEACLEISGKDYLVGMQDMGAAGLTSSSSEMATRGKSGITMDLTVVPQRADNLTPYEMMLSESQERMVLVVKAGFEDEAIKIFQKWELEAVVMGTIEANSILTVKHKGDVVAQVPVEALTDQAPVYDRPAEKPAYLDEINKLTFKDIPEPENLNEVLLKILASPAIASKKAIYEQYDHMVGTNTVIQPGQGDAAVLRIRDSNKGIALTIDGNSRYCYLDPNMGGKIAVAEAARNLVCVGAKPLAITDGLNFGSPENKEVFWQFKEAVIGIKESCQILDTPVVGGNVSFYNETNGMPIYPSPIIGMLGLLEDIKHRTTMGFKQENDAIFILGDSLEELGGSEYIKVVHNLIKGRCPGINLTLEKNIQDTCLSLIQSGFIQSAHDISEGGLAVTLAECCIQGNLGASLVIGETGLSEAALLFGESQSRIIISVSPEYLFEVIPYLEEEEIPYMQLGLVTTDKQLKIDEVIDLSVDDLKKSWESLTV